MSKAISKKCVNETDGELRRHCLYLNRQRACICCAAVLIIQSLNLFGLNCKIEGVLRTGSAILIFSAIVYPLTVLLINGQLLEFLRTPLYMCYWAALCVGMTPFIAGDINNELPFNAILLCLMLALFPIFTLKQSVYVALIYTICNVAAGIYFHYSMKYAVCLAAVSVCAFFISRVVSRSYIALVRKLLSDSMTDYHTRLLNRRGGFERLEQAISSAVRNREYCAVMMIDIDDFKFYNDTYGHSCGDEALKDVASALGESFKRTSDVIFRYGGEEFVAAFTVKKREQVEAIANGLLEAIGRLEIKTAIKKKNLSASIGVAIAAPNETDNNCASLIARADSEMYKAKEKGKNCCSIEQ